MAASIAHMKEDENASTVDRAKARLHRWISQLSRLQEVHAQMAVMYLRGVGDTFASHETVPMLSRPLLLHLRVTYPEADVPADEEEEDSGEDEDAELPTTSTLRRSADGSYFTDANQIDDYIHRDINLSNLSFYEFVCCIRKEKSKLTSTARLGSFQRYSLQPAHPQSASHTLIQRQDPSLPLHRWKTPPRVIGMQVPRKDSKDYHLFMLGHFKPFSALNPLLPPHTSYSITFHNHDFSPLARTIMRNWEDVHECEDERDAERTRKKTNLAQGNVEFNAKLALLGRGTAGQDDDEYDGPDISLDASNGDVPSKSLELVLTLKEAGWFEGETAVPSGDGVLPSITIPRPSAAQIKEWACLMKVQEENVRLQRMNNENALGQLDYLSISPALPPPIATTMSPSTLSTIPKSPYDSSKGTLPKAVVTATTRSMGETAEQLIERIGNEMTLNKEQWIAYRIMARKFVSDLVAGETGSTPLRLLLTGPGRAGKSHVVKTFSKLMDEYGMSHKLQLVAPTGSAASLIDASTIHKGLGIRVKRKKDAKNLNGEDLVASVSKKSRLALERTWRPVDWLFCDECSLVGSALIAEFDQMLKLIKAKEVWFGGINIVFAGDFSQYPPVLATPLYEPIGHTSGSKTNSDFLKRLGRLAWLSVDSVVELQEQKRMSGDPGYGETVARLRMRQCLPEDVELFNSRVVAPHSSAKGVRLSPQESSISTTIVRDNRTRWLLNGMKASATVNAERLVICAARDFNKSGDALEGEEKETHLLADFSSAAASGGLPSFIPLAVGMNVVLRTRNISSELKISNGSMGVVMALFTSPHGQHVHANGAVVHFPASPVQLPNLPQGCIHLVPESKTYRTTTSSGEPAWFRREQLIIEPAYAVTGHFAQGKTLPVVVANLKHGRPAAYVAASRPKSRGGLFLTSKVTLRDLNEPPHPPGLLREMARIEVLKHNTLVDHGFLQAERRPVPNEGAENQAKAWATRPQWAEDDETKRTRKRKANEVGDPDVRTATSKRRKVITARDKKVPGQSKSTPRPVYPLPYLRWDSVNYSCAYDSLLTSLYAAWSSAAPGLRARLQGISDVWTALTAGFGSVDKAANRLKMHKLHEMRERVRDLLSQSQDSNEFPRYGPRLISLDALFAAFLLDRRLSFRTSFSCTLCGFESIVEKELQYMFYEGSLDCFGSNIPVVVDVERWVGTQLATERDADHRLCSRCQQEIPRSSDTRLSNLYSWPPIVVFHPFRLATTHLRPSATLMFPRDVTDHQGDTGLYQLFAVTYHGQNHFTARICHGSQWFNYDGMAASPSLMATGSCELETMTKLDDMNGRIPTHYVYIWRDADGI